MAWLKLSDSSGKPVLVNMSLVLRVSNYNGHAMLLTIAPEKEGVRRIQVKETLEEVMIRLSEANEEVG